jgi:hypothetical protein
MLKKYHDDQAARPPWMMILVKSWFFVLVLAIYNNISSLQYSTPEGHNLPNVTPHS